MMDRMKNEDPRLAGVEGWVLRDDGKTIDYFVVAQSNKTHTILETRGPIDDVLSMKDCVGTQASCNC